MARSRKNKSKSNESLKQAEARESLRHQKKENKLNEKIKKNKTTWSGTRHQRRRENIRDKGDYQAKINESSASVKKHQAWAGATKVAFAANTVKPEDSNSSMFRMPNLPVAKPQPNNANGTDDKELDPGTGEVVS
jgi:hypothetical protein